MSQAGLTNISGGGGVTQFNEDTGSAVPAAGIINIVGGTGISTTGSGNTITINATGGGETWSAISASQALAVNHGYACVSPGGALSLSLPAVAAVGSEIEVTLDGATSWTITQGAGQQIRIGNTQTTLGATGTLGSTAQGDTVRMVCTVANLKFNVLSSQGNITVV